MQADQSTADRCEIPDSYTAGIIRDEGQTLFEAIIASDLPCEQTHIVWRSKLVCALLNRYPYSVGHMLVVPCRAVSQLEDLTDTERLSLWEAVHLSVAAVKAAFEPDGVNIGANIGLGAGPSVADHLHIHVLPRWMSDTNFITTIANARVLPQTLDDTWRSLRKAWPTSLQAAGDYGSEDARL